MLHAVIMAGGSGTRFWPQSRKRMPKQLLKLAGDRTMIQQTVDRCETWIPRDNVWVVTNAVQADETSRQLPDVPREQILLEPCGRNTAPCIGLAAIQILAKDPDGVMFVMPADHVIQPREIFQAAGQEAARLVAASPDQFVLFGVPPTYPATGYGYIERGAALAGGTKSFHVASFREKPAADVAQQYIDSGLYYWNCGIFCWSARGILAALERYEPEIHARLLTLSAAVGTPEWDSLLQAEFPQMKDISIDYAVLERADTVAVVEAPYEWDDVGSWLALPRLLGTDANGNTLDGPHIAIDTNDTIIRTTDDHVVAALGVKDLIIVHTPDATLVAHRSDADSIRKIVASLQDCDDFRVYL